jgi:hypothetical protein
VTAKEAVETNDKASFLDAANTVRTNIGKRKLSHLYEIAT